MIIGVPKEIKIREYRVGMVPASVRIMAARGHRILVEQGAGEGSGILDEEYVAAGAEILESADEIWGEAEMVVKVKEPIDPEYSRMRKGQIIYTYLHLAACPDLVRELVERETIAIGYETIQEADGSLPLLTPMSEVAGKMAIQVGAYCLETENDGKGILLGGVPGVQRGKVVILGGGTVGTNAARIAVGLGAHVTIMDISLNRLRYLEEMFSGLVDTMYSNPINVEEQVEQADLVVGAVLIPGARAPMLVSEDLIERMGKGSVVVDVAVDQGGCISTCRPTTHDNPTYIKGGVVHYCVANMPGAVARTSTFALTNATMDYANMIADLGIKAAIQQSRPLYLGVNTCLGTITCKPVAAAVGLPHGELNLDLL